MTVDDEVSDSPASSDDKLVGIDRVLAVLTELSAHPDGIGLNEVAAAVNSPKSTAHRALAALRKAGFATQDGHGHYVLGDKFLRMAFQYHEARPDHIRVQGVLRALAEHFGETAHYTVLDGRSVVYRSKVDPPAGAVKLTSTVGGRNPAHATGAGKALLAYLLPDEDAVRAWVGDTPLERRTKNTKATVESLNQELAKIRELGYAVDDEENEPGVNCIALPVFLNSPSVPSGSISISAVRYRTPLAKLIEGLPEARRIIDGDA